MPLDRRTVEALGRRLERAKTPQLDDLEALAALQSMYLAPLEVVTGRLRGIFGTPPMFEGGELTATSRLKTVATIVEKLRHHETGLHRMRDIVGVRIVGDFMRSGQDRIVALIAADLSMPESAIIDRRETPRHGYRAVHLVAEVDGYPIEIQVRTLLQHLWANAMERFADRFGRQVRYGGDPSADTPEQLERLRVFLMANRQYADALDAWEIAFDLESQAMQALEEAREASAARSVSGRRMEELKDLAMAHSRARKQAFGAVDAANKRIIDLLAAGLD